MKVCYRSAHASVLCPYLGFQCSLQTTVAQVYAKSAVGQWEAGKTCTTVLSRLKTLLWCTEGNFDNLF